MADPAADTLAARLARVARDVRHCPVHELPIRASVALGAHGLAVVASSQRLHHPEGVRRPVVLVSLAVADAAGQHPPTTFEGLAELNPIDLPAIPLPTAILTALEVLWVTALGVDIYHPLAAYESDPGAWERHLAQASDDQEMRGSWRKHRGTFESAGVYQARRGAALDAIARFRTAHALTFTWPQLAQWLDAAPEAGSQPRQRASGGAPT